MNPAVEAYCLVYVFFKGDREKVLLWYSIPNPLLGGLTPRELRDKDPVRLLKWVRNQLAGNGI